MESSKKINKGAGSKKHQGCIFQKHKEKPILSTYLGLEYIGDSAISELMELGVLGKL